MNGNVHTNKDADITSVGGNINGKITMGNDIEKRIKHVYADQKIMETYFTENCDLYEKEYVYSDMNIHINNPIFCYNNISFDEPLEFDDNVTPERLGEMILEAFDRSRKMAEQMSGEFCPAKRIELLDETIIEVTSPKDKHFIDCDDAGVGELYQLYSYIAKEGANSSADFMLTVAPELYEALNCDNIRSTLIEAFGATDDLTVTETQYGIYQYRAEMTNKKMYRIAYFTSCKDGLVLECCMEVVNPSKKKKLIEKLPTLFEEFDPPKKSL